MASEENAVINATNHNLKVMVGMLLLVVAMHLWAGFTYSPTTDEVAHLPAGLSNWQLGRFELYSVNPPLVKMVAAVPVCWMAPVTDWSRAKGSGPGSRLEFSVGGIFIEQNGINTISFFRAARLACISFSILGGWVCFLWGRAVFGDSAGLLAGLLWCLSPMILAHGSLITPDVAAAAFGVSALYRFRIWLLDSSWWNTVILGVITGLALLTKFTWIPIFPLTAMIVLPVWRSSEGGIMRYLRRDVLHLGVATLVALYCVNAMYAFDGSFTALGDIDFVSATLKGSTDLDEEEEGRNSSNDFGNRFAGSWLGRMPMPLPIDYIRGIDVQRRDFASTRHSQSYLMGEWRRMGWWYYYFVALAVKEPLPTLILFICAASACIWRCFLFRSTMETVSGSEGRCHRRREELLLCVPALLVMFLVMSHTEFSRHLRYLLPAYPFAFIFMSQLAVSATRSVLLRWSIRGLIAWQMISVALVGPNWVAYFNECSGGPSNGSAWLLNSNIDWGQDLLQVERWQASHPEEHLHLALKSSYDPCYVGLRSTYSPTDSYGDRDAEDNSVPAPGWHAVSVTLLRSGNWNLWNGHGRRVAVMSHGKYFQGREPEGFAGYSIALFHVPAIESDTDNSVTDSQRRSKTDHPHKSLKTSTQSVIPQYQ